MATRGVTCLAPRPVQGDGLRHAVCLFRLARRFFRVIVVFSPFMGATLMVASTNFRPTQCVNSTELESPVGPCNSQALR